MTPICKMSDSMLYEVCPQENTGEKYSSDVISS